MISCGTPLHPNNQPQKKDDPAQLTNPEAGDGDDSGKSNNNDGDSGNRKGSGNNNSNGSGDSGNNNSSGSGSDKRNDDDTANPDRQTAVAAASSFDCKSLAPNINAVTADLTLPTSAANGAKIAWFSSTPSVIDNSGKVTRPSEFDKRVVMSATFSLNNQSSVAYCFIKVLKVEQADDQSIKLDAEALTWYSVTYQSIDQVRNNLSLPVVGKNGSQITWSSSDAAITPAGVVTRPAMASGDKTVLLKATLTKGVVTQSVSFTVTVLATTL